MFKLNRFGWKVLYVYNMMLLYWLLQINNDQVKLPTNRPPPFELAMEKKIQYFYYFILYKREVMKFILYQGLNITNILNKKIFYEKKFRKLSIKHFKALCFLWTRDWNWLLSGVCKKRKWHRELSVIFIQEVSIT